MMKNFASMKRFKNKKDGWAAWNELSKEVGAAGYPDIVEKHRPRESASLTSLVISLAALQEAYDRAKSSPKLKLPRCPQCGSLHIETYMMIYGPMWCQDCGFRVEDKTVNPNPFTPSEE